MKSVLFLLLGIVFANACQPMPQTVTPQAKAPATAVAVKTNTPLAGIGVVPIATRASSPTPYPTRTPNPAQTSWRGDLHMHTTCSDGKGNYEEMVEAALKVPLDFMALTDHTGFGDGTCQAQVREKCRAETRLLCIPGSEVSGKVHLLALGIQTDIDPKLPLKTQVDDIHAQGGLAVAAHPYLKLWRYTEDELVHSGFDAMECNRGTAEENKHQLELSSQFHIPCVYNSDTHYINGVGAVSNVCSVPIHSLADLKAALLENKCKQK